MAWTYADLKAADLELDPPILDPEQAAMALREQTVTLTDRTFQWAEAKHVARTAPTGDWARIVARARLSPTLPPVTVADMAILAAINAVESADTDIIDPNSAETWPAWQAGLSVLHQIGDLSDATLTRLNALTTVTIPRYSPAPTSGDLQTARNEP